MSTAVRISVAEFDEMVARGDFADDDQRFFELIEGEIVEMPRPSLAHEDTVDRLNKWGWRVVPDDGVRIRIQGSIEIPDLDSVPFPNVSWLFERDYSERRPLPSDVLLVIEVSDSTLSYDRNKKARLYAAAGLADYWIANIKGRCVEVRRDPGPKGFKKKSIFHPGDEIRPLALPEVAFPVSLIFPEAT